MIVRVKDDNVLDALRVLAQNAGGILKAETVLAEAEDFNSPLHSYFTWDDGEAAGKYRLHEARNLIRCSVITEPKTGQEIRAFVSLTTDRLGEGGGYRETIRVLGRKDDRAQMLDDALAELQVFEQKYQALTELAEVFAASRKARKK